MATFDRGDWVKFTDAAGRPKRGHVSSAKGRTVRLVDLDGRQYSTSAAARGQKVSFSSIQSIDGGVFVLDTQLDRRWRHRRESARFWEEYCRHAEWKFGFERVHSLGDLEYFFFKRQIPYPVVILSGHGDGDTGWEMTNGDMLNIEADFRVAEKNKGKVLLLSACGIGKNARLCRHLKEVFGARAIIAYTNDVNDDICFLVEPALMQLLFETSHNPSKCVEIVREAFEPWKNINVARAKKFPLVCY
jgi:hypothetical protein